MDRWAALSAENSLKTDLAHRTAELVGIGGMTDVNGQPGMMLGADAGGGNSVMYPQGFGYGPGDLYGTGAYSISGMSSQASPLHEVGISGATMYGSSAIITASGKSVAGQVTSTSATVVEKPKKKKKKNKVFGFLNDAADFLILDDVKTVFDSKASFLDKGVAIFSVTPAGKAVKAGRLGFKLVQNSPVGKIVSKKVDQVVSKVNMSRKGAFNEAKRDAGIPRGQQPETVMREPMRTADYEGGHVIKDRSGKVINTREYHYENKNGEKVIIQDHSAGHSKGGQGPHFNVRPKDKPRTGKYPGTKEHYPFDN